ncbi:MAG: hypothetical protein ACR2PT_10950, partial [Endozoicomonas sp.]
AVTKDQTLTAEQLTGLKYNAPTDYKAGAPAVEFSYSVSDGKADSTGSVTITVTPVNQPPTAITLTTSTISESVDTSGGRVKVSDIQVTDDGVGEHTLTLNGGKDAKKLEVDGTALYLKKGEKLNFEESRFLKFKITATDSSDQKLSYTTPEQLKVGVEFSYSPDRPYVNFKTVDGGQFGSDVVAGDTDSFGVRFHTAPGAIGKWQLYDYRPYQPADYGQAKNVVATATVKANDTGVLEFRLSDFGGEHLDWNLYKSRLSIKNDGGWDHGKPFDFGLGVPSHSYTFDHADSGHYWSSTFAHKASKYLGNPETANGFMGKAVDFGGKGQLIVDQLGRAFSSDFSICYRVMTPQGSKPLTAQEESTPPAVLINAYSKSKTYELHLKLGFIDDNGRTGISFDENRLVTSPVTIKDGLYHHVCLVRDYSPGNNGSFGTSNLKVFVDREVSSQQIAHTSIQEAKAPSVIATLGPVPSDSGVSYAECTYDNLHIYPFALNKEAVHRDYTVDAHVMGVKAPGSLELGQMFNYLLPSVIAEKPQVLWMKFLPYPDNSLNADYKFKCTYDDVELKSEDGHLFQLNQPTTDVLRTLHCEPVTPKSALSENPDITEYRVAIDPDQEHFESAPAAQLWIDNANTPLGDQIMFHKGDKQQGSGPGEIRQKDIFLADKDTDKIINFNASEGDILDLRGHASFQSYLETHKKQDLKGLFKDAQKVDDHTQVSLSDPGKGADAPPLMVVECLNPPSFTVHLDDQPLVVTL